MATMDIKCDCCQTHTVARMHGTKMVIRKRSDREWHTATIDLGTIFEAMQATKTDRLLDRYPWVRVFSNGSSITE